MLQEKESPLQPVWNGISKEYDQYRNNILGQLLTLIDATIVEEKQNKSIKDLIRKVIWEDTRTEFNFARWLNWLEDNYALGERGDSGSTEPMKYDGVPASNLKNFK